MNVDWGAITHVTKVDPAESLPVDLGILEETDLVIVGGSDGVTTENTLEAIERVTAQVPDTPVLQEPYSVAHVTTDTVDAADAVAIPAVYNGDRDHFVGKHVDVFTELASRPTDVVGAGVPIVGDLLTASGTNAVASISRQLFGEGYVVQHLASAAAAVSGVTERFTPEQVAGAALATETFYGFPVFYVEYSGTYGGTTDVEAASKYLEETTLLYGGGIDSREKATAILEAGADAIVVGDCFHEDPDRYLETIPA